MDDSRVSTSLSFGGFGRLQVPSPASTTTPPTQQTLVTSSSFPSAMAQQMLSSSSGNSQPARPHPGYLTQAGLDADNQRPEVILNLSAPPISGLGMAQVLADAKDWKSLASGSGHTTSARSQLGVSLNTSVSSPAARGSSSSWKIPKIPSRSRISKPLSPRQGNVSPRHIQLFRDAMEKILGTRKKKGKMSAASAPPSSSRLLCCQLLADLE